MADAADYSQLTSALSNLTVSNTNLANALNNNSFGSNLTASIESAFQKISQQKKSLPVHDAFLSDRVFNKDWLDRENTKVNTLKAINDLLQKVDFQTLNTKLNDAVKTITDSLKLGNAGNNPANSNLNTNNSASITDKDFRQKTLDFYKETLHYLDAIASHTKLTSSAGQMGSLLGDKLGQWFGGGKFGKAFGDMVGDTMSRKMQDILTRIFNGESISKILYGMLKGTVGRLLSTVFAPIKSVWNGVKGALGFAGKALLKFSEIVFGASAKVVDFFEKVTPLKSLLGIIPEAVTAVADFINMLVMFPINKIKETQQLAYSTMDSLTGKINDVMATYGVGQEQAMRMIFQQEVMLQQMPYIYRDSFKVQADITEQYRNLIKTTGMTVQQAQGLAPILDKFKNSILEGIDLAGSTLVKLGSKLYGDLDHIVDSYGSTLIRLQNSMNINASQVNQQFQDNFAEYFELTTYNSDELIDKSTSMIKTLADLNSTVIDSNKLLQNIAANRDKTMSEFFSTDFGRSVMMTSSNSLMAKMWLDSRDPENLKKFYEDRFAGIQRRLSGFTPETLNTEYAYTYLKALSIDVDEARQVLKQGATAQTFQKFSEEKKADRWEEVLKTLAQDYHREWARGHVFIGPDSEKLLRMGQTWGEDSFVKAWQDAINGKCRLGINFDSTRNAQMLLSVMDAYFGKDFTANVLSFMSISVRIANDIFGALVHFSSTTLKFIGHFATHGFDVFNPESGAYQNMIKDVLPSVAMGITASDFAAQNMGEAVGQFADLMGQTVTSLVKGAQGAGEKYKGLNVGSFVSDPRLLNVANTTLKSLSAYNFRLDENGNPIYTGTDSAVAQQFGTRYAQLRSASASGPKAVFASISKQLSDVIYDAVSKALEGFPGYNTVRSVARWEEGIIEQITRGGNYSTELNNLGEILYQRAGQISPEKYSYGGFEQFKSKRMRGSTHNAIAELIRELGLYDPQALQKILLTSSFDDTFGKGSAEKILQRYGISEQATSKPTASDNKTTTPRRMFSQEEVSQMNPFGKPISQELDRTSKQLQAVANQQSEQWEQYHQSNVRKNNATQAINFAVPSTMTPSLNNKSMEVHTDKITKQTKLDTEKSVNAINQSSRKTNFVAIQQGSATRKQIHFANEYLEKLNGTTVRLADIAMPAIIFFNKFNNNLAGRLNTYLTKIIKLLDKIESSQMTEHTETTESSVPSSLATNITSGFGTSATSSTKGAISEEASKMVSVAQSWVGKEFNPGQSAQCANFVRQVSKQAGVNIGVSSDPIDGLSTGPALASSFSGNSIGEKITLDNIAPGDIVMYKNTYGNYPEGTITHVGIYEGNGMLIHRPTATKPVTKVDVNYRRIADIRRPYKNGKLTVPRTAGEDKKDKSSLAFTKKDSNNISKKPTSQDSIDVAKKTNRAEFTKDSKSRGILDNTIAPFTTAESGMNLISSSISGTVFDGLRPFLTGPMYSGSWQVDDRYNINQDGRTISEAGVKQQHIYDYLSIWNNGRDISGSANSGSIFGGYAQKRASTGDNTLYSMGWMGDETMLKKHPEYIVKDPKKYGLVSSLDILEPGFSMQKKGTALVVVKTPIAPPAPPAGTVQKHTQQQQEMVDAMKTTAKAAVAGAKANEQTAKAVNKLAQQAESSKNIGPTWDDYVTSLINSQPRTEIGPKLLGGPNAELRSAPKSRWITSSSGF